MKNEFLKPLSWNLVYLNVILLDIYLINWFICLALEKLLIIKWIELTLYVDLVSIEVRIAILALPL